MKRSLKIFELSANEQRVVLIVMLILVVIALIRYERRVHQAPVEPVGTSAHSPSPNPPSPEEQLRSKDAKKTASARAGNALLKIY